MWGEQSVLCNAKLILGGPLGPPSVLFRGQSPGKGVEPDLPMAARRRICVGKAGKFRHDSRG